MKFSNKKKIILGSIIGVLIGTLMSVSYAFFTYANTSGENSTLVAGNIWMRYRETNTLTLEDAMPSDTYDATKKLKFTIDGTNTTENKDVWYEIKVKHGTIPEATPAKSEEDRIPDRFIKYKLVKEVNNVEQTVVDGDSWEGLSTGKVIYVDKIEKNKSNQVHNYKLYMWISNKLEIGTSPTANFTINDWNKAFASIKVDVTGDFTEKTTDEPYQTVNAMNTFPSVITDQKANIKEVYFNKMSETAMETTYNNATIKADLTYNNEGKVLAWLETNQTDNTKYNLIVASDGNTYLTTGRMLFSNWSNVEKIEFNNINTGRVSDMYSMFYKTKITQIDISSFDTSNVTTMELMFAYTTLTTINLSNKGSNVLNSVSSMFNNSSITDVNFSSFNFGIVSNFTSLFNISSLTKINLSNARAINMTSMSYVFSSSKNLEELNLKNFYAPNLTQLSNAFSGLNLLRTIDFDNFQTGDITTMPSMFYNCSSLKEIDLSWLDTGYLTSGGSNDVFNKCTSLEKIYVDSSKWDMSNQPSGMPIFGNNTALVGQAPNTSYAFTDYNTKDKTYAVVATDNQVGYLTDISLKPAN